MTALGNLFEGEFRDGSPYQGAWTSPNGTKTPYLAAVPDEPIANAAGASSSARSHPNVLFALEMVCNNVLIRRM